MFEAAEVTATPVYEIDQLLDDPHVQARGVLVEAPDDEAGSVLMHNVIPRLSRHARPLRLARAVAWASTPVQFCNRSADDAADRLAADGVIAGE